MVDINEVVLLIEDAAVLRHFLRSSLSRQNYEIVEASTGEDGLAKAAQCSPDVILLDLGLPDMDGIEVATRLRDWMETPIIVLSARDQEESKVAALDAGADDYLTKPIGVAELQARIRVALRHSRRKNTPVEEPMFQVDGLRVDLANRKVTLNENELRLTPIEYKLLAYLVRSSGKVIRHRELLQAVWGEEYSTETNYLRIYIKHLRDKIGDDAGNPRFILNEPGIGYRFLGE
ncbi:KDP operon transcriptional regulatory protein KdpE [Abditibacteriota bacterium]|nr:KDP operon transcriptional regulatory protein KdpE [Abditibacteriota bacterium]